MVFRVYGVDGLPLFLCGSRGTIRRPNACLYSFGGLGFRGLNN